MTGGAGTRPVAPELTVPLVDETFYAGDPFPHYARLRREAPLVWHQADNGHGWWVVSTHPEVLEVSKDPARFCSGKGILTMEIGFEYPSPPTMMHTDPPDHTRYRKLVTRVFSVRAVEKLRSRTEQIALDLLDRLAADGHDEVDIVPAYCTLLPVTVIAEILGVPISERERILGFGEAAAPSLDLGLSWKQFRRVESALAGAR